MAYLEFRNIQLKFDERMIFSGFNLAIERHEKVLFCAPSGRGKTSLVKMLLGFVAPDRGEILVDGTKLTGITVNQIRSKISYVSQDADIPKGIVRDVFEEVFKFEANRHLSYNVERLQNYWLDAMSLPKDTLEKNVDTLSGGERQRLALILGILLDRDIWILDEITTGLDLELKTKMVDLVLGYDKTILVVSHDDIYKNQGLREVSW
ncbi:ATP-binding cassette domain-containing protein [Acetobacterium sp. KB-1]|jgi:putative ABC transport system ATP-binding protein|uniref:ABC transporter ATP-binding protein n=1 Tax=Acetobacterium sp. KB-1 TaxID=2184575 RepID=UPI000DBEABCA|nr:ATP-binding cassette domain-containing protein [Acetobacterium sp. KB-1]AWW27656.1 ABC transporter ATP-binding protein [Acetobacterium sp. KB-1]